MSILITGDSHAGVLNRAWKEMGAEKGFDDVKIDIRPIGNGKFFRDQFFQARNNFIEFTIPEYKQAFGDFPPPGKHYDFVGLSMPLHTARVFRNPDWASFTPPGFVPSEGEFPVSKALFKKVVLRDQLYVLQFIDVLQNFGLDVFAVEPPYPFRHHPIFKTVDGRRVLQVNRFYREVVIKELQIRNVQVVRIPEQCIDAEGFMDNQFRSERENDQHHANTKFGVLMVRRIIELTKQLSKTSSH